MLSIAAMIIIVVLATILLTQQQSLVVNAQAETWSFPNSFPTGRKDFGFACTDNFLSGHYIIINGGSDANGPVASSSFFIYDPAARAFSKLFVDGWDKSLTGYTLHTYVQLAPPYNFRLGTFGGRFFGTGTPTSTATLYDAEQDIWRRATVPKATTTAPDAATYWHGSFYKNDWPSAGKTTIFFFQGAGEGGFSGGIQQAEYTYTDTTTSFADLQWKTPSFTLDGAPLARHSACCAVDPLAFNTLAFCFGGTSSQEAASADFWMLDFAHSGAGAFTNWTNTMTGTKPSARRRPACAFTDANQFTIWGGFDPATGAAVQDTAAYTVDVTTMVWTKQPALDSSMIPTAGAKMASCFYGNGTVRSFLFGGVTIAGEYPDTLYTWDAASGGGFKREPLNVKVSSSSALPQPRAFLGAVADGSSIFLLNGITETGTALRDGWRYDLASESWSQVGFAVPWTARHSAPCVSAAGLVYSYSGVSQTGALLRELLAVDLYAGTVQVIADSGDAAPYGRGDHVSFAQNNIFIVAGGYNDQGITQSSIHGFDIITRAWIRFSDENSKANNQLNLDLRRRGGLAFELNSTTSIVGLGLSPTGTKHDWFFVSDANSATSSVKITKLDDTFVFQPQNFIRYYAAGVVAGQYILYCGGLVAPETSPPDDSVCVTVDILNKFYVPFGDNTIPSSWVIAGGAMVSYGKSVYILMGKRSNGVSPVGAMNEDVLKYDYAVADLCAVGQTIDCVVCAAGSVAPLCEPVPAGSYSSDARLSPQKCPAGTVGNRAGANSVRDCLPVSFGYYSPAAGSTSPLPCPSDKICPIGSSSPLDSNSAIAALYAPASSNLAASLSPLRTAEEHPPDYKVPGVPLFPVMFILVTVLLVLLVIVFVIVIGSLARARRFRKFMTPEQEAKLSELYDRHAVAKFGMDERCFITALTSKTSSDTLPPHNIDPAFAARLFSSIDQFKAHALFSHQWLAAICLAIELGRMAPFPLEDDAAGKDNTNNDEDEHDDNYEDDADDDDDTDISEGDPSAAAVTAIDLGPEQDDDDERRERRQRRQQAGRNNQRQKQQQKQSDDKDEEERQRRLAFIKQDPVLNTQLQHLTPEQQDRITSRSSSFLDRPFFANFELSQLDTFEEDHLLCDLGDSPRLLRTWYGGVGTLVTVVVMITVTCVITISQLLSSVVETKAGVPYSVARASFKDANLVQVAAPFDVSVTYFAIVRNSQSQSLKDACIKPTSASSSSSSSTAASSECASASVKPTGFKKKRVVSVTTSNSAEASGGAPGTSPFDADGDGEDDDAEILNASVSCSFDPMLDACTVSWKCGGELVSDPAVGRAAQGSTTGCYIQEGESSLGSLLFLVSPAMAATAIQVTVSVGSGIHAAVQNFYGKIDTFRGHLQYSTVSTFVKSGNTSMLSGLPASAVTVPLTPTYAIAENFGNLWGGVERQRGVGYHCRLTTESAVAGNIIAPVSMDRFFDVPVSVKFPVDSTPLLVRRLLLVTIIDILSALAGALAAVYGGLVASMKLLDKLGRNKKAERSVSLVEERDERLDALEKRLAGEAEDDEEDNEGDGDEMDEIKKKQQQQQQQEEELPPFSTTAQLQGTEIKGDFDQIASLVRTGLTLEQADVIIKMVRQEAADLAMFHHNNSPATGRPASARIARLMEPRQHQNHMDVAAATPRAMVDGQQNDDQQQQEHQEEVRSVGATPQQQQQQQQLNENDHDDEGKFSPKNGTA